MPQLTVKYARRGTSNTLHLVSGIDRWYRGMTSTSKCGVAQVDVLDLTANEDALSPTTCKRCKRRLDWA
jgi:hypothetical protein